MMDAICYPVVYPRRPPSDDDLVWQAMVWHCNALSWDKAAARCISQKKWSDSAIASRKHCEAMFSRKLDALPAYLKPRALAWAERLGAA